MIWKDIEGYEGLYQVSDTGLVRTVERIDSLGRHRKSIIRKTQIDRHGYEFVLLFDENQYRNKRFSVHVLVANAFIERDPYRTQVNHIDGCKTNNRLENLERVTASENQRHAIRFGLAKPSRGEECYNCKVKDVDVERIRMLYKSGKHTYTTLADMFGISYGYVGRIVRGERRLNYGY